MEMVVAFAGGIVAGLGLAAPLGAIGVLLIREGLGVGFRAGSAAAAGVALVDAVYCVLAVLAGALAAPAIASWGSIPSIVGGAVLVVIGVRGVWRSRTLEAGTDAASGTAAVRTPWRRFLLFVGLTAINPATLLYFAAVTVALGSALTSIPASAAFVGGVAVASLGWQLGLVAVGAVLRTRITPRAQRMLSIVGFCMVIALGVAAAVGAIVSAF